MRWGADRQTLYEYSLSASMCAHANDNQPDSTEKSTIAFVLQIINGFLRESGSSLLEMFEASIEMNKLKLGAGRK